MTRSARMVGVVIASLCALSGAAQAAQLKIGVPHRVRSASDYTISISGSYRRSEVRGRPFLIAAIQFSGDACQRTAQEENALSNLPQFLRWNSQVGISERRSPFTTRSGPWVAKRTGPRHICAWLYPAFSGPADTTRPIATADASYRVTRR